MSSKTVSEATPIILTNAERAELESLVRSTKTEHRTLFKAQIVLLAAAGVATRAIAREVGCTTGTASKWRVRYARKTPRWVLRGWGSRARVAVLHPTGVAQF